MKYTLTIEADSVTDLFDALNTAAAHDVYQPPRDTLPMHDVQTQTGPEPSDAKCYANLPITPRVTLPTGDDPTDVYGPGNGPVDAHRPPAAPVEAPSEPPVDANDMPWDERIHAGSKMLNADGTWRKKRGVSDELVAEVEASHAMAQLGEEHEDAMAETATETVLTGYPMATIATVSANETIRDVPTGEGMVSHTPASIMSRIAALVTSGDKTPAYVQEIVKLCDLADGIAQIASDSDALERVVAALQADGVL